MTEGLQKYEILALFPLTGTEEELKAMAGKIEERIRAQGGAVVSSVGLQKGKLPYSVNRLRQAYHHLIQFEMLPAVLGEFQRALLLGGDALRFTVTKIKGTFRPFIASPAKVMPAKVRPALTRAPFIPAPPPTFNQAAITRARAPEAAPLGEVKKAEEKPVISMEELDRKLEEILGK
ncbi:30S ribosomal protein S6 [Candidatus Uhrbacteria bacterium]|nr:30S ribosomal protein S6 [Candidatus Uhrbacteria bacterium]